MKFMIDTATESLSIKKPVAEQKPVAKAFDQAAALEAMNESFQAMTDAYEHMVATEGLIAQAEKVMGDIAFAQRQINKFGATPVTVGIFNCDGSLEKLIGTEGLTAESVQSMTIAARKVLKDNLLAGLEGADVGAVKAWAERVKTWLKQFIEWFKQLFIGNARMIENVKNLDFTKLDTQAAVSAISATNAEKICDLIKDAATKIKGAVEDPNELKAAFEKIKTDFEGLSKLEAKTVSELGWTAIGAQKLANEFKSFANSNDIKQSCKTIQTNYSKIVSEVASGSSVGDKYTELKMKVESYMILRNVIALHTKMTRALGVTLMRLASKQKKEEAKA